MNKFLLSLLFFFCAFAQADNFTIQLPDYICSGSPTGWTVSAVSGGVSIVCASSGVTPPTGTPTGCIAKANAGTTNLTLAAAGGNVAFTSTCVTPSSGITWSWIKNGVSGANTTASWTDNFGANVSTTTDLVYTYQVRACNGANCTTVPTSPLSVTVSHAVSGGWNGTCPGFDNTIILPMPWVSPTRLYTRDYGGFGPNDIVVVRFTAGNNNSSSLAFISGAEYVDSPSSRIATLSSTPCDFSAQSTPGSTMAGNSITSRFAVGTGSGFGYYPVLTKGATYYLNVKNTPNSTCISQGGTCNMFFDIGNLP